MREIELKNLRSVLDNKINSLVFDWFVLEKGIKLMKEIDERLRVYSPSEIIDMTKHDEFDLNAKYYYHVNVEEVFDGEKLVTLSRAEIEKRIAEEVMEEDFEKIEKYIIERLSRA